MNTNTKNPWSELKTVKRTWNVSLRLRDRESENEESPGDSKQKQYSTEAECYA